MTKTYLSSDRRKGYIDFKDKRYQDNLLNRYTTLI